MHRRNKIADCQRVRDIVLSDKVRVLNETDTRIVLATAPKEEKVEEVVAEAVEGAETTEPEVIEKGKNEGVYSWPGISWIEARGERLLSLGLGFLTFLDQYLNVYYLYPRTNEGLNSLSLLLSGSQ